jgi:hypothetical protein
MRVRVVATLGMSTRCSVHRIQGRWLTLSDVNVVARISIEAGERGSHVDAMLRSSRISV